jgi:hypothetical protein
VESYRVKYYQRSRTRSVARPPVEIVSIWTLTTAPWFLWVLPPFGSSSFQTIQTSSNMVRLPNIEHTFSVITGKMAERSKACDSRKCLILVGSGEFLPDNRFLISVWRRGFESHSCHFLRPSDSPKTQPMIDWIISCVFQTPKSVVIKKCLSSSTQHSGVAWGGVSRFLHRAITLRNTPVTKLPHAAKRKGQRGPRGQSFVTREHSKAHHSIPPDTVEH